MRNKKEQELIAALESAAKEAGFELVDLELTSAGRHRIVRVFIERDASLTVDDLAAANVWIDGVLERIEPFTSSYTLEVSSPGIDRPLRTAEHFARFAGEDVRLKTEVLGGRSSWSGVLGGIDGTEILLDVEGTTHRISLDKVKKAHVVGKIDFKASSASADEDEDSQ